MGVLYGGMRTSIQGTLLVALVAGLLTPSLSRADYGGIRTCGEYLADIEIRRETYTAGAVYALIKRDDLGLGAGSALIAMNPMIRQFLDLECTRAGSEASAVELLATKVMPDFSAALAANPQD